MDKQRHERDIGQLYKDMEDAEYTPPYMNNEQIEAQDNPIGPLDNNSRKYI